MNLIDKILDSVIAWSERKAQQEKEETEAAQEAGRNRRCNIMDAFDYCAPRLDYPCTPATAFDDDAYGAEVTFPPPNVGLPVARYIAELIPFKQSIVDSEFDGPVLYDRKRKLFILKFKTKQEAMLWKLTHGGVA